MLLKVVMFIVMCIGIMVIAKSLLIMVGIATFVAVVVGAYWISTCFKKPITR